MATPAKVAVRTGVGEPGVRRQQRDHRLGHQDGGEGRTGEPAGRVVRGGDDRRDGGHQPGKAGAGIAATPNRLTFHAA